MNAIMSTNYREPTEEQNELARLAVHAAYKIHKSLGPGLLENVYEACMVHELRKMGLTVESQILIPIHYDGIILNSNLRIDLLINNELLIEIKAVEKQQEIYQAQVLTYLKLMNKKLGLLINFNTVVIKDGIQRVVYSNI